ncbi:hypothetical protein [Roseibacillus ishigakijimensis]|nr:hypothetical protein [Roseibacillus ishigakijimensis]
MSDEGDEWGHQDPPGDPFVSSVATEGGTYTRAADLIYTGPSLGDDRGVSGTFNGISYGPYDGTAGYTRYDRQRGVYTRTDPNAIFDLSPVGSKATIRTAYLDTISSLGSTTPLGHILQFGLSNNANTIGSAGNQALFVAMDMVSIEERGEGADPAYFTYDLNLYDTFGGRADNAPLDQTWNWTALASFGGASDSLTSEFLDDDGGTGNAHAFELTFTNIGNDQLRLQLGVAELLLSGRRAEDSLISSDILFQGEMLIDLTDTQLDLTSLRPAFGFNFNQGSGSNDYGSELVLDWEEAYPTGFSIIPEPSVVLLGLISMGGLTLRRRR